ncbi:Calcineurin-like phosphoesterase [Cyclobacterium lianum]|uniref:Calcineurin-like phosphoesterase n=1 Tax=Cyclobacterium lianum TaxID=388280 RepID=A0A1M7NTD6_9BACT|nr:metallophosphoesterase [Cyclobacterium lianum]SHN07161.1 Calcineurin-like phosphoesterase [Cyclobacterium lianum]
MLNSFPCWNDKPADSACFFMYILALALCMNACSPAKNDPVTFMAIGDVPYHLPEDFERFERLIGALNEEGPDLTLHVGDIKSGSTPCTDEYYEKIKGYFDTFSHPLVYTPGDNEWTDCYREACGGYEPEERLDKLRQLFFSTESSQGKFPIELNRQNSLEGFEKFPENAHWKMAEVTFGTLHLIGSNNNFKLDSGALNDEFYERELANNFWLQRLFEQAEASASKGLVLVLHAALNYNSRDERNGHASFVQLLQEKVMAFGKPVLLLYGDHHRFMVDQPLRDNTGKTLTNFTAVQVFGDWDMHAVRVSISPDYLNLFRVEPFYISGN